MANVRGNVALVAAAFESSCNTSALGSGCSNSGAVYAFQLDSTSSWALASPAFIKQSNVWAGSSVNNRNTAMGTQIEISASGAVLAISAAFCWRPCASQGIEEAPFNASWEMPPPGYTVGCGSVTNTAESLGAIYMFRGSGGGGWVQEAIIFNPLSTTNIGYQFGTSISLSDDGTTLAVGGGNSWFVTLFPTVIMYRYSAGEWIESATIIAGGTSSSNDTWYQFGYLVGLSGDGTQLLVGPQGAGGFADPSFFFTIHAYERSGPDSWVPTSNVQIGLPSGTFLNVNGPALNFDGSFAVQHTIYGADVLTRSGVVWTRTAVLAPLQAPFLRVVARLSSDASTVVLGAHPYVFVYSIDGVQRAILTTPDVTRSDNFGYSVALSNSFLIVGAQASNSNIGVGYVFPVNQFGLQPISFSDSTVIQGSVTFSAGSVVSFAPNATVFVNGTLTIASGAAAQLVVATSGTVLFVSASSIVGAPVSVTAVNAACPNEAGAVSNVLQTSTTISSTVALSACASSGLSTGAIVGIALGAAVAGVLIVLLIVLLTRAFAAKHDSTETRKIRQQEMDNLRR
jgi:hypothetical protein